MIKIWKYIQSLYLPKWKINYYSHLWDKNYVNYNDYADRYKCKNCEVEIYRYGKQLELTNKLLTAVDYKFEIINFPSCNEWLMKSILE